MGWKQKQAHWKNNNTGTNNRKKEEATDWFGYVVRMKAVKFTRKLCKWETDKEN